MLTQDQTNKMSKAAREFFDEAVRLRNAKNVSEVDFYEHLWKGERTPSLWSRKGGAGTTWETFEECLKATGIAGAHRYARYVLCREEFGIDKLRNLGFTDVLDVALRTVGAACKSSPTETDASKLVILEAEEHKERNGVAPGKQTMESIVRKHVEPTRSVKDATPYEDRVDALKAERDALEAECESLKRQNGRLVKALEAAKALLVKKGIRVPKYVDVQLRLP